jgi:hypothetical protein
MGRENTGERTEAARTPAGRNITDVESAPRAPGHVDAGTAPRPAAFRRPASAGTSPGHAAWSSSRLRNRQTGPTSEPEASITGRDGRRRRRVPSPHGVRSPQHRSTSCGKEQYARFGQQLPRPVRAGHGLPPRPRRRSGHVPRSPNPARAAAGGSELPLDLLAAEEWTGRRSMCGSSRALPRAPPVSRRNLLAATRAGIQNLMWRSMYRSFGRNRDVRFLCSTVHAGCIRRPDRR